MGDKNLMDTQELKAIKEEHSETLAVAINKLGSNIKTANGSQKKQDNIRSIIAIGSLVVVIITIIGYMTALGAWKKEIEMTNIYSVEAIKHNTTQIKRNVKDVGEIKSDLKVIRVEQRVMQDDVKKILKKVE
jgi:hypothetical protein